MENKRPPRKDIFFMELEDVKIDKGFNQRFDYGDLESLANSIMENGVLQPIHVFKKEKDKTYYVLDGHRRFKACKIAKERGWTGLIPVLKTGNTTPTEAERTLAIITHNGGKPLNLLEEGMVYRKLLDLGMNNSEISRKVGKSVTHIISCAKLFDLKGGLVDKIKSGVVTATMVIDALKDYSEDELDDLLEEKSNEGLEKITLKHLKPKQEKAEDEETEKEPKTIDKIKNIKAFLLEAKTIIAQAKKDGVKPVFVNPFYMIEALETLSKGKMTPKEFIEDLYANKIKI